MKHYRKKLVDWGKDVKHQWTKMLKKGNNVNIYQTGRLILKALKLAKENVVKLKQFQLNKHTILTERHIIFCFLHQWKISQMSPITYPHLLQVPLYGLILFISRSSTFPSSWYSSCQYLLCRPLMHPFLCSCYTSWIDGFLYYSIRLRLFSSFGDPPPSAHHIFFIEPPFHKLLVKLYPFG